MLARSGLIELETFADGIWDKIGSPLGNAIPQHYRIAPPKPMVLEFSHEDVFSGSEYYGEKSIYLAAKDEMRQHKGKRFKIHAKLTATEITETP